LLSQPRATRLTALLTILLAGFLVTGARVGSHVPITTRITFNREVVRILREHCLDCHSPEGIKYDLPLLTYAEARPWAKAIKEEILNRRMAPHQVVKGYGRFRHDYLLAPREQDQLISWIEGGVPKGEERDYPGELRAESGEPAWSTGKPDLILQPPAATKVPPAPFTGRRCQTIPLRDASVRWISRLDFRPEDGRVVESASFYLAPASDSNGSNGCRLPEERLVHLGEWVPGQKAASSPEGMGRLLPPRATIVIQIQYRGIEQPTSDRSRLALYFAPRPVSHLIETRPIRASSTARGARIAVEESFREDRQIVGIRPLLPRGASSLEARLINPDGTSEVLIFSRNFQFDWRPTYYFRIPRPAPAGSRLSLTAYTSKLNSPVLCQIVTARVVAPPRASTRYFNDSSVNGLRQH